MGTSLGAVRPACPARLRALVGLFGQQPSALGHWAPVPGEAVPEPYSSLLVHDRHMTVTIQAYYGARVNLRVLDQRRDGDHYSRKIVLALEGTGRVAEFAVVRCDLRECPPGMRQAILEGKKSLGLVLIEHVVHRRVVPELYLRVRPSAELRGHFGLPRCGPTYGRLATVWCDRRPAIRLLEVITPGPGEPILW